MPSVAKLKKQLNVFFGTVLIYFAHIPLTYLLCVSILFKENSKLSTSVNKEMSTLDDVSSVETIAGKNRRKLRI